ncbi:hypothetical protein [Pseudoflavitalea rhizosphaerae]|uniref:hypothetical protein n=1 Tax=Pseudoflavitalea rhizosphaerae TaxID=1884793 RepID=UPI000F8F0AE6|nr:hypothetical protein [Pseudoflavitalea rhizosphaerae]
MKFLLRAAIYLTASAFCVIAAKSRFGGSVWLALLIGVATFSFLWYAYKDFQFSQLKVNSRKTGKAIVFSTIVFAAAWNCFAPKPATGKAYAKVTLSGLAEKSPISQASEVWVLEIINKDSGYDLSKIKTEGTEWEMKDGKLLFNRSKSASIDILIEDPVAPSIRFLAHSWSGKVRIQEGKKDTILDLGAASESYINYPVTDPAAFYQDLPRPVYHLMIFVGALLTMILITMGVLWLPREPMIVAGVMIWSGLVLFLLSDQLTLTRDEKWVLPILTVLIGVWAGKGLDKGVISSYSRKQQLGL